DGLHGVEQTLEVGSLDRHHLVARLGPDVLDPERLGAVGYGVHRPRAAAVLLLGDVRPARHYAVTSWSHATKPTGATCQHSPSISSTSPTHMERTRPAR